MTDRILLILKAKNLSSSQFADKLGVQRSNISHILSGRNKPSLDFIMKIKNNFPEINTDWLLFGKGEMFENVSDKPDKEILNKYPDIDLFNSNEEINIKKENEAGLQNEINISEKNSSVIKDENIEKKIKIAENEQSKTVEMIVIFYKDKTYKEYYPNK